MNVLETLNHLTMPAALVIVAVIAALAWLGTKNFFVAVAIGIVAIIAAVRFLFGVHL